MAIYTPYFYIIQDRISGMYYAGSKYGKDANPETFMVVGGYTTSSETINRLIRESGLSNFAIRKIRIFETGAEAYLYEKRFLEKVNARSNPRFYNRHNNKLYAFGTPEYKELMNDLIGAENPSSLDWVKEKVKNSLQTNNNGYTLESDSKSRSKFEETMMKRHGVIHPMNSDSIKKNHKQIFLDRHGVENPSQSEEIKAKKKETMMKNYGGIHPNKGRIVITNGIETKFCRVDEIPEGWWKGRPK